MNAVSHHRDIAAAIVTLELLGLRELHWHPNAEEWLYFHQGQARATVFVGGAIARTFDFIAGDTAVLPDNSGERPRASAVIYGHLEDVSAALADSEYHQFPGHYVEDTSPTEQLVWIELYKSDRVADVSLTQWLAITPAYIVASTLKISLRVVNSLKKEKQQLIAAKG